MARNNNNKAKPNREDSLDRKLDSRKPQEVRSKRPKARGPIRRDDRHLSNEPRGAYECDDRARMSGLNDISWYTRNPLLLQAAGMIPYPYKPGMGLPLSVGAPGATIQTQKDNIPGVMALYWAPYLGRTGSGVNTTGLADDPVNIVAREIFSRVRQAFSGTLEADPADFMMYLGALDSFFCYIGWLKRVYRAVSLYTPENYVMPDVFLRAMGFSEVAIQALRTNKVLLWNYINELVYLSRKLKCPAVMDVFNRHYWMSDNVYLDAPSPKAQMFIFNLAAVYQFQVDDTTGGWLKMTPLPALKGSNIVQDLASFGRTMYNLIANHESNLIISGYLMRAYEGVPSFEVQLLSQDEIIQPLYVEEVLTQIENSNTIPIAVQQPGAVNFTGDNTPAWLAVDKDLFIDVKQTPSTGLISVGASFNWTTAVSGLPNTYSNNMVLMSPVLTSRSDAPTVADNVIMTRLKAQVVVADPTASLSPMEGFFVAATEVPLLWTLTYGQSAASVITAPVIQTFKVTFPTGTTKGDVALRNASQVMMQVAPRVAQFDWHPLMFMVPSVPGDITGFTANYPIPFGDLHNTTTCSREDLANLHRVCVLSEFNAFGQG